MGVLLFGQFVAIVIGVKVKVGVAPRELGVAELTLLLIDVLSVVSLLLLMFDFGRRFVGYTYERSFHPDPKARIRGVAKLR
jgi:hypothetical protein